MESLRAEVAQIFHQLGQAPGDNQVKIMVGIPLYCRLLCFSAILTKATRAGEAPRKG